MKEIKNVFEELETNMSTSCKYTPYLIIIEIWLQNERKLSESFYVLTTVHDFFSTKNVKVVRWRDKTRRKWVTDTNYYISFSQRGRWKNVSHEKGLTQTSIVKEPTCVCTWVRRTHEGTVYEEPINWSNTSA